MKLNALLKTLGFLALAATPVVAGTMAPAPKNPIAPAPVNDDLGINASLGYDTNYIFRGVNMGQHWVRSAIDGSLLLIGGAGEDAGNTYLNWDVQFGTLAGDQDSLSSSVNRFASGNNAEASFQRLQLGAAIAHDFGPATISLGYRYFRNMGDAAQQSTLNNATGRAFGMNDAQEVSLGLATSIGPIDLASSAIYDITNQGWYFDVTASTTVAITDSISFVPSVNVGYAKDYAWQLTRDTANVIAGGRGGLGGPGGDAKHDYTGWASANVSLAFPVKLNSRATLTPYIAANLPLSGLQNLGAAYRNNSNVVGGGNTLGGPDGAFKSLLYGGVTLSVRF